MRKIPTLFQRDPDNMKHVLPEVTPGCEWVLAGEGVATRKYDGTCCMFDGSMWWARREVRPGKPEPDGFVVAEHDPVTGKTQGWVPMTGSSFELCGPRINGNPEGLSEHRLIRHGTAQQIEFDELTFENLRKELTADHVMSGMEGVVWRHPDGRMAKLKARDFPQEATR